MPDTRSETEASAMASARHDALGSLCGRYDVVIAYAFGSRTGEIRDWIDGRRPSLSPGDRDVDVGVKCARGTSLTVQHKVALAIDLEDLLACDRVDLVVLDEASAFLAEEVISGERIYARDERLADEYDLYVLRRAGDQLPLERERAEILLGRSK
jgi:hypothetical protein